MSQKPAPPKDDDIIDEAWKTIVGGVDWLKSVVIGEFADNRPLSAVVADMLVSFVPGVVIVTSARDAVAVILRLASHPEKREELMEWVLLSACLIVIALPLVMAAVGAAGVGVGAVLGGIAGSELGAALRAVMLMLIKEANKLVELVCFLQQFIKGDILKFLRAIKFVQYEKALLAAMKQITGKLVQIVREVRRHLERLRYFDAIKSTIANLEEWERRFYRVRQDALRQMPKALAELDARLSKVLAQTAPREAHTVAAGVQANKAITLLPVKQRVQDTPGKVLANLKSSLPNTKIIEKAEAKSRAAKQTESKSLAEKVIKDKPDPVKVPDEGLNTKRQEVAAAAAAADRERITQLSREARDAERSGNKILAKEKIEEARKILKPHLPEKNSTNSNWDEVVKRLDVSSPKDGAVFWSGTSYLAEKTGKPDAARVFAEKIGGVTLETTPGGRIIDGWDDVNIEYPWNVDKGPPPWASQLWGEVSEKYANSTSGVVNVVQTSDKLWSRTTIWHTKEKPLLLDRLDQGKIDEIKMHVVDLESSTHSLSSTDINQLLKF